MISARKSGAGGRSHTWLMRTLVLQCLNFLSMLHYTVALLTFSSAKFDIGVYTIGLPSSCSGAL